MPPSSRRRVSVETGSEEKLLTGLIVDNEYCRRVLAMIRPDLVEDQFARRIIEWVRDFHEKYGKAPGLEIQDIFRVHKERLGEDESTIIEAYLGNLSRNYAAESNHNWPYQIDLSRDYLRTRALKVLSEMINGAATTGNLDQGEQAIRDFGVTGVKLSQWIEPYIDADLHQRIQERKKSGLFRFDGPLGEMLGWMHRGWLVSFFGPMKRGKTWWLGELTTQAVIQGLKVAFVSCEMGDVDMGLRFIQQATALGDYKGMIKIPVWDCKKNQEDTCDLAVRTNIESVPRNYDGGLEYDEDSEYRPCTYCKDHPKEYLKYYRIASWFDLISKVETIATHMEESIAAFALQYRAGRSLKMMNYPRNTATVDDLMADLDELESSFQFVPDIIIVDYADILIESGKDERERLDKIWKKLAALAGIRKVLVVTASQGTRKSLTSKSFQTDQVAEDIRKLAHIDLGIGLNQITKDDAPDNERKAMIMRLSVLAKRHGETPTEECFVLQNLGLGQPALDTYTTSSGRLLTEGVSYDD